LVEDGEGFGGSELTWRSEPAAVIFAYRPARAHIRSSKARTASSRSPGAAMDSPMIPCRRRARQGGNRNGRRWSAAPATDLFFYGTIAGGLGVLILMSVAAVAVVRFFHRHPLGENRWRRRVAPIVSAAFLITMLRRPVRGRRSAIRWPPWMVFASCFVNSAHPG
jgi:hypothetical protein